MPFGILRFLLFLQPELAGVCRSKMNDERLFLQSLRGTPSNMESLNGLNSLYLPHYSSQSTPSVATGGKSVPEHSDKNFELKGTEP